MPSRRAFLASVASTPLAAQVARPAAPATELQSLPVGRVKLLGGVFSERARLNREYVCSLKNENLLQNHYLEAGLWSPRFRMTAHGGASRGDEIHWGWESPTCQVRGHFLGHWLSAASSIAAATGDAEIRGKAERVVAELARVQKANGGRWVASIPEKYLDWVARKKSVWAPHYTIHKTFMGLVDAHLLLGSRQALTVAESFALWLHDWSGRFTRAQMDDILDVETGGMLEVWADLYAITGKSVYRDLMARYDRPRLFDRLLAGKDPLTNKHANTTIPEAHGAARAYEATGEKRWRDIVLAYWKCAVTTRGAYATGGQTNGEIWTPPGKLAARLGEKTQEHCVVYNMIRLADYLLRWTGEPAYADYIERNLYNGVLAQQHPQTGMVAYFLPLAAGSKKQWGTPTNDFWCCHGSLVQAHARHDRYIYYAGRDGLAIAQYIPSEASWTWSGKPVRVAQSFLREADDHRVHLEEDPRERPNHWLIEIRIDAEQPVEFTLRLRMPWWLRGKPTLAINDQPQTVDAVAGRFLALRRAWGRDRLRLTLPKGLAAEPLPDRPDSVAFLDGPVVLAGLSEQDVTLAGDPARPASILAPDNEREWANWIGTYRTVRQTQNVRFVPLHSVTDQAYTLYFPVARR
jgi:DUF1680 family protein